MEEPVRRDVPEEVAYRERRDRFVDRVPHVLDLPSGRRDLPHCFLRQHRDTLSKRARTKQFAALTAVLVAILSEMAAKIEVL